MFRLNHAAIVRVTFRRDEETVMVDDEVWWEELCLGLADNETISVDFVYDDQAGIQGRPPLRAPRPPAPDSPLLRLGP
jgi:hypothetical protein